MGRSEELISKVNMSNVGWNLPRVGSDGGMSGPRRPASQFRLYWMHPVIGIVFLAALALLLAWQSNLQLVVERMLDWITSLGATPRGSFP